MMKFIDNNPEQQMGFTIVEALIGITILAAAIAGPMTAAQLGISTSRHARDVLSASFLAGEAVELLRNERDAAITTGDDWKSAIRTDDGPFEISGVTGVMRDCGASCSNPLYYSPSRHLYGFDGDSTLIDWEPSMFTREVEVEELGGNEVLITVTMEWEARGDDHSYVVHELLTNWYDTDND